MAKLSKLDRATAKRKKLRAKGEAAIKAGDQLEARRLRQRYDRIGKRAESTPIEKLDEVVITSENKKTGPKGLAIMGSKPRGETSGFGLINKVMSKDIKQNISDSSKTGEIREPTMVLQQLNTKGIKEFSGDLGITTTLDVREKGDYAEKMLRGDFDVKTEKLLERREGESRRQHKKRIKTWDEGFSGGDSQYSAYNLSKTFGSKGKGKIALGSTRTFTRK